MKTRGAPVDGATQIANFTGRALLEFPDLPQWIRRAAFADGQIHKIILALLCFFKVCVQSVTLEL